MKPFPIFLYKGGVSLEVLPGKISNKVTKKQSAAFIREMGKSAYLNKHCSGSVISQQSSNYKSGSSTKR
jgi:hypothetical protein